MYQLLFLIVIFFGGGSVCGRFAPQTELQAALGLDVRRGEAQNGWGAVGALPGVSAPPVVSPSFNSSRGKPQTQANPTQVSHPPNSCACLTHLPHQNHFTKPNVSTGNKHPKRRMVLFPGTVLVSSPVCTPGQGGGRQSPLLVQPLKGVATLLPGSL